MPCLAAETFSSWLLLFTLLIAKQYVNEMMNERETNKIRNVTGIAIPFLESKSLEDAFFRQFLFLLEKRVETRMEVFCSLFFEKRPILTFSGRDFFCVKNKMICVYLYTTHVNRTNSLLNLFTRVDEKRKKEGC